MNERLKATSPARILLYACDFKLACSLVIRRLNTESSNAFPFWISLEDDWEIHASYIFNSDSERMRRISSAMLRDFQYFRHFLPYVFLRLEYLGGLES